MILRYTSKQAEQRSLQETFTVSDNTVMQNDSSSILLSPPSIFFQLRLSRLILVPPTRQGKSGVGRCFTGFQPLDMRQAGGRPRPSALALCGSAAVCGMDVTALVTAVVTAQTAQTGAVSRLVGNMGRKSKTPKGLDPSPMSGCCLC